MIKTDNVQMNKVFLAFSVLLAETKHLSDVAEHKFYGPLTMFGVSLDEDKGEHAHI